MEGGDSHASDGGTWQAKQRTRFIQKPQSAVGWCAVMGTGLPTGVSSKARQCALAMPVPKPPFHHVMTPKGKGMMVWYKTLFFGW